MDAASLSALVKQALVLVLLLSLPTVLTIAIVGLLVALVQAVTQVQESSVGFGVKLIAAVVVIAATAQWSGAELYHFVDGLFAAIATA